MRVIKNHKKRTKKDREFIDNLCYRTLKQKESEKPIFVVNISTGKVVYDELTQRYSQCL